MARSLISLSVCIMLNKDFYVITSGATLRLDSYLVDAALNERGILESKKTRLLLKVGLAFFASSILELL